MLGCLTQIATLAAAVAAGLGYFSFWWTLIPAFFAGSLALSNGPHYSAVILANERGDLKTFPMLLSIHVGGMVAFAAVAFWITKLLAD